MQKDFCDALTGKPINATGGLLPSVDKLKEKQCECNDDEWYLEWIDNTDLRPEFKNLLKELVSLSICAGKFVFSVGKMILNIIIKAIIDYPHTTSAVVIGVILALLVSSIPVFGQILLPLIAPVLVCFTLLGISFDVGNKIKQEHGIDTKKIAKKLLKDFAVDDK